MRTSLAAAIAWLPVFLLPVPGNAADPADLVLRGGVIWTADATRPRAEAIAVRDETLVYVGDAEGVASYVGTTTRVVDLDGRLVVPGFNDNHVHFEHTGRLLYGLNLLDVSTAKPFADRVRAVHERFAPGTWITGGDWSAYETWSTGDVATAGRTVAGDYGNLFTPHRNLIDGFTGDRPVLINRYDRKVYLANGAALALAGISRGSEDPDGIRVARDDNGEPTGILYNPLERSVDSTMLVTDNVRALYMPLVPPPSREQAIAETLRVWQQMREVGVTSYSDVTSSPRQLGIYRELREKGLMSARVRVRPSLELWEDMARLGIGVGFGDEWIRFGAVKAWIDGIMGNSSARFYKPYTHNPASRGIWRDIMFPFERSPDDPEQMQSRLERLALGADAANIQLTVHAIGDEANGYLLDMVERLVEKNGERDRRFRLVHAQVMNPDDIERAGRLGIVAEMQPYHCADDMRWMEERIGRERARGAYAFRSLWDAGAVVCFGSDSPGTNASRYYLNPMLGLYAAVTRQNMAGEPRGGWFPEERLTVDEALTAYTYNTAYAAYEEDIKGKLAPGMLADLVVLSDNLFDIRPTAIKDVTVEMTIVGGQVVFEEGAKQ
ncbi:MAG: amidohydrolase [Pseudomonadota bacterium]